MHWKRSERVSASGFAGFTDWQNGGSETEKPSVNRLFQLLPDSSPDPVPKFFGIGIGGLMFSAFSVSIVESPFRRLLNLWRFSKRGLNDVPPSLQALALATPISNAGRVPNPLPALAQDGRIRSIVPRFQPLPDSSKRAKPDQFLNSSVPQFLSSSIPQFFGSSIPHSLTPVPANYSHPTRRPLLPGQAFSVPRCCRCRPR